MSLNDFAGVFSRYFVVGFFVPAFVVLVAVSQVLPDEALPAVYLDAGNGARVAVLGGASLLAGLILLGMHYQALRLFEGYPLAARWYTRPLDRVLKWRQSKRLAKALKKANALTDDVAKSNALWHISLSFSTDDERVLPTSFGNAVRAFEITSTHRWGLNAIAIWPRIQLLLTNEEQRVVSEAESNVAFFINGALLAALAGFALGIDKIVEGQLTFPNGLLYLIPFAIAVLAYRASIGTVADWGSTVIASIDLHRREAYTRLGVRKPVNFSDERNNIAPAVSATLLFGEHIPDDLAASEDIASGGRKADDDQE